MTTLEATQDRLDAVTGDDADAIEALSGRLFGEAAGATHLLTAYLGIRLGLFEALARQPGRAVDRLAEIAGVDARYAAEWVQAEVLAGLVVADGDDLETASLRLAPGVREAVLEESHPAYLGGLAYAVAAVGRIIDAIADAYRTGAGVAYESYGLDGIRAQAALNRPAYVNELAAKWMPAMPDVDERLRDGLRPARVADVGCGVGWAAIELARAFPAIRVEGIEVDARSIAEARRNAEAAGVADRVDFRVADASGSLDGALFDLILFLESLHDMAHPVEALANARRALAADGGATDCAGSVEAAGGRVKVVPGDERLLKVTTADDLAKIASWL